ADGGTEDEQGQHYGTHKLAIKNSAGDADVFNIWMFDSGSYDPGYGYSCVQQQQVDWFNSANAARLPSFAFQHIIVKEIWDILEDAAQGDPGAIPRKITVDGEEVTTYIKLPDAPNVTGGLREVPGPGGRNFGQYQALCDGGVLALFVGHDHVNTYQFKYTDKTDLVNSPCTGFGSYGDIDLRGARIITLKESDLTTYETSLVSFQTFYYFTGHPLRDARLKMYQSMGTPATLLDWLSFKPLLWVLGLFDK
ncbi:MAG: hypothetical protein FWF60_04865, partial [Oscillospiraceae bacterium]|nr:hypothetical protein [Oscillospiraceae bacterium]